MIMEKDKPLKFNKSDDMDEELGIRNPYSRITCFTLYLYSMEFGTPPLYSEVNRVQRDMDMKEIKNLGPFSLVMTCITLLAEKQRD